MPVVGKYGMHLISIPSSPQTWKERRITRLWWKLMTILVDSSGFSVAPAPISSRFFCPRPPLLLSNQNRHATQATWRFELSGVDCNCVKSQFAVHHLPKFISGMFIFASVDPKSRFKRRTCRTTIFMVKKITLSTMNVVKFTGKWFWLKGVVVFLYKNDGSKRTKR